MLGGYRIIDLKGVDLIPGEDPVTVDGVYDKVESARKVVIFSNFSLDGVEHAEVQVNLSVDGTTYEGAINGSHKIQIGDDDAVQIATI